MFSAGSGQTTLRLSEPDTYIVDHRCKLPPNPYRHHAILEYSVLEQPHNRHQEADPGEYWMDPHSCPR